MERACDGPEGRPHSLCATDAPSNDGADSGSLSQKQARPMRSEGSLPHAEGSAGPDAAGGSTGQRQEGRSHPATHVLLALGDEGCASESDSGTRRASRPDDDAAVYALESRGIGCRDSVVGIRWSARRPWSPRGGGGNRELESPVSLIESVEAAGVEPASESTSSKDSTCVAASEIS